MKSPKNVAGQLNILFYSQQAMSAISAAEWKQNQNCDFFFFKVSSCIMKSANHISRTNTSSAELQNRAEILVFRSPSAGPPLPHTAHLSTSTTHKAAFPKSQSFLLSRETSSSSRKICCEQHHPALAAYWQHSEPVVCRRNQNNSAGQCFP